MGNAKYTLFLMIIIFVSCATVKKNTMLTETIAFRLKPGEDVKKCIDSIVVKNDIKAGYIATAVGSLTQYHIRFANVDSGKIGKGYFEVVSLVGTLSINGSHLHISVSDNMGTTIGGHLLTENFVYTTLEIVIVKINNLSFTRENDGSTPWKELKIEPLK